MNKDPFLVLMAEDDEHDIVATKRAWKKHHIVNSLHIVYDGEECLDFLYHRGKYDDQDTMPQPGILLLDIKMPKMDGLAVLKYIRNDGHLRRLPVIILTTSKADLLPDRQVECDITDCILAEEVLGRLRTDPLPLDPLITRQTMTKRTGNVWG